MVNPTAKNPIEKLNIQFIALYLKKWDFQNKNAVLTSNNLKVYATVKMSNANERITCEFIYPHPPTHPHPHQEKGQIKRKN